MKKVILIGYGAMGQGIAELLLEKDDIVLSAIIDKRDMEPNDGLVDVGKKKVPHHKTIKHCSLSNVDVAIVSFSSYFKQLYPVLQTLIENNINIITIGEEMAHPFITDATLAKKLDELAKLNNVSILGTGINPGFVLDTLILVLTSTCFSVEQINAIRANDLSAFGASVLDSQGVGLTIDEYKEKEKTGEVVGHIGFPQSVQLIGEALNWEFTEIIEKKEPIISTKTIKLNDRLIKPGMVKGCNHQVIAKLNGQTIVHLRHPQQVGPTKTKDEVEIIGKPNIHLTIEPEIPGGIGTIAIVVNLIPLLLEAKPGIVTMLDLPRLPTLYRSMS